MHVIDIRDASSLMDALTEELKRLDVHRAALTLIGGVDTFRVSNMPADDAGADVITDYDLPGELTGTGEVVDGRPHVHITCGIEGDTAKAGHLHDATVFTHFVKIFVHPA